MISFVLSERKLSRKNRAAMPFGAPILCPTMVIASTFKSSAFNFTFPNDCAASVCTKIFGFVAFAKSANALTGCTAPVSLFACIIVTQHTLSRNSANCFSNASTSAAPSSFTGTNEYVNRFAFRSLSKYTRTAGCSTAVEITCGRTRVASSDDAEELNKSQAISIARLSLSVPQLVNTISFFPFVAPKAFLTLSRLTSMATEHGTAYA
mmetsp:Transcript_4453/g.15373  ORF Transcript_4453/g.15373 Transcript_4453/m.15373 type:complete len:208 (-) Transcript_4453:283-906(-)